MITRTAVLIPHYQHAPGILARTLRSVFAQVNTPPLHLIIVDDGSPVSTEGEIACLDPGSGTQVTIIHRPNGGTSRARNTGLEAIPRQADYVALLDGDDIWREDHLSRALEAMEMGFDFFFSDHRREGYAQSWFHEADFRPERHTLLKSENELYAFDGSFFDTILRKSPVGTSTVVMRQATLGNLRFDNDVGTYDDLLFWLKVAQRTDRIAFSACELVTLGEGINQSIVPDWRSNKSLRYGLSEASYFRKLQSTLQLAPAQQDLVGKALRKAQNSLARTLLAMVAAGRPVELRVLARTIRNHPAVLAAIPPLVIDGIRHKIRKYVNAGHSADA